MISTRVLAVSLLAIAANSSAAPCLAQSEPATQDRLETFVQDVASLWSSGDVDAIVALLPADNQLRLDTGAGLQTANSRHAAAALRALFADAETIDAEPVRVTVASAAPPRGFAELSWTYRARGAPAEQSRSVYVATLHEDGGWRITELRLMP